MQIKQETLHNITWKTAPFIRLLVPFITGILIQHYFNPGISLLITVLALLIPGYLIFELLPFAVKYKKKPVPGTLLFIFFTITGSVVCWQKDITHNQHWMGNQYHDSDMLLVKIIEPPVEKAKSVKAICHVDAIFQQGKMHTCTGKLILYFEKDSGALSLHPGETLLFNKPLQVVKNTGNPGAFNYKQYAAFQQIHHTVYLKRSEYSIVNDGNPGFPDAFLYNMQQYILSLLHTWIEGKEEAGIAEALLIGYKEDLDRELVQAYSNTGVVHIIAISGLHLGLIYMLLIWIFSRLPFIKKMPLVKLLLVLSCLWLFTLLTGASASVLRSAVMFSFIAPGKVFGKKAPITNSLAVSALLLLVYNPFFLWDVGFQLSYLAVLGIVLFQQPVYQLFYFKNKWIDKTWNLVAVSIAAQILTFPVCIYYFHQFPNYFLLTNIIAVPLSSLVLFAEIFLVAFAWLPQVGFFTGKLCNWMLWLMNKIILLVNDLPFSLWDGIPATIISTIVLYWVVIGIAFGLKHKNKFLFKTGLVALLIFAILSAAGNWLHYRQRKIIVYNISQNRAIDLIRGNEYLFSGDSVVNESGLLQYFHLKPARTDLQLRLPVDSFPGLFKQQHFLALDDKRIVLVDQAARFLPGPAKINVDIVIISKNPSLHIAQLAQVFNCSCFVFDASNSLWKIEKWKKECEELHLRCYSVPEKGAFVLDTGQ